MKKLLDPTKKDVLEEMRRMINPEEERTGAVSDEQMLAYIENELNLLAKRAESAKASRAKKKAAADTLVDAILGVLTNELQSIAEVTKAVNEIAGNEEASVSMVTYRLNALAKEGKAEKAPIALDKRKIQGYKLAD